jgi:hypothetical protein
VHMSNNVRVLLYESNMPNNISSQALHRIQK